MALTLIEAAKAAQNKGNTYLAGIIELYAQSSDILQALPFTNIQGNALKYNREEALPGVGFRGVNEGYTESTGILNPVTETLTIAGGDLDVDKFIVDTMGEEQRTIQEAMKIKALAGRWTRAFIKGDTESDPKEFSGLQSRITGDQLISAGSTANGAALSLAKLDELIDLVDSPTHLLMNKAMRRRLTTAARSSSVGGYITYDVDAFGRQVTKYNDLPIVIIDKDNEYSDILGFSEAASSGTATATSIYCISATDEGVSGIQNGGIDARDLGELEAKPAFRTRVEWYPGMAIFKGRAAARLRHIGDLAVVA
jgi:hypothetical protein